MDMSCISRLSCASCRLGVGLLSSTYPSRDGSLMAVPRHWRRPVVEFLVEVGSNEIALGFIADAMVRFVVGGVVGLNGVASGLDRDTMVWIVGCCLV